MPEQHPHAIVGHIATGFLLSRCLHAVLELGVPDALGNRSEHVRELAAKVGAEPEALSRVLRMLSTASVFLDMGDDRYSHSAASRVLRSDHPQSMVNVVRMWAARYHWAAYEKLPDTLRTGRTAFDAVFGTKIFDYFGDHPDEARIFDKAMTSKAAPDNNAVLRACDFSRSRRIVDIGGGVGHLVQQILVRQPHVEGVLFDLPGVIESARTRNVPRLSYHAGDFFSDPIPSADTYLLMQVLHDWSDADCLRILRNVRRAMPEGARVLVIEMLLNKGVDGSSLKDVGVKLLDVEMLTLFGGRERTRDELAALFAEADLELTKVDPTATAMNVLEVVARAG